MGVMKPFLSAMLAIISTISAAKIKAGETIYFLVGPLPNGEGSAYTNESFVLPLSNQEDIDYARYLISRVQAGSFMPGDRTIVVANIVTAMNDINRNYQDPRFPKWHWQLGSTIKFSEIVAEGEIFSPSALEQFDWSSPDPLPWEPFYVGFAGLYVVKELGPVPLYLSVISEGHNLQFYWSGLGTNYVYTLEGKESLARTNWIALPGASWPLQTNHWSLALTNTTANFFRVRANQASQ